MCAGFGKRLKPLTNKVPKPLLKIDNKSLLENTIELLFRLNINKIFLNSHHLSQQIKRFILEKKLSKKIKVFEEKRKILNTGGGILNIVKSSNDKNYLVLNPDSATNREVVQVTSINVGTKTLTLDNINKRYLTGSAASSGLSHASGSVVRMSPLQQHIEDINDRVDTVINAAGTAVNTTLFLDEDDMSSNSATKGVTQQSVKAYVDTQLTAEDLDISADSGSNIAIDLDSEVLDLEGGTGIDTTTGTNKVTFAIDSTVATLTGSQTLTNKTIDVDSNTVSNIEVDNLKSGVLDTDLSSVSGSDDTLASAKAIKAYVDAVPVGDITSVIALSLIHI